MAELRPAPFRDLVTRLHREPAVQDALFELPRRSWWLPTGEERSLAVLFHGNVAGNPSGPAAGPHTQMAQNLLLSYVAGGRILELKTVQVDDALTISRPCIDMTNIGYNVEWSQELRVEDSLREYVAGAMLIEIFRHNADLTGDTLDGPAGAVIYDTSVGYDLEGIRSAKVGRFLDGMRDARELIEKLRNEIPSEFHAARRLYFPFCLSNSVTLSTFHGCPADQIERICEYLIGERGLDVIVKMNPPTLGREQLEHLLYDVMGYTELRVNENAYLLGLGLDEAVQLCERLTAFARQRGRRCGFKFSNTLEVRNHRDFFTDDNEVMYLSGQPLHVITMALTDVFRRRVGPHVPISFSAGIDRANFALAVACGFVPVTISTDLLRPGGYGRLPAYLRALAKEMRNRNVAMIDDYVLSRFGVQDEARKLAVAELSTGAEEETLRRATVHWAGLLNTTRMAELAREDVRYRAAENRRTPRKIDSHLEVFDCITCDKCLPVCPNAANFLYPTPVVAFDYRDLLVEPDGTWREGPLRRFEIEEALQIACYADFCNECGNCDTFCPEYGGPYIKKPSFYGCVESWERAAPRDGFALLEKPEGGWIRGRIKGALFQLDFARQQQLYVFDDGVVETTFYAPNHQVVSAKPRKSIASAHTVDVGVYHTLRYLREGVLNPKRINQINVAGFDRPLHASAKPG